MREMINSPLEQFEIVRLIPVNIGLDISFTNASLLMCLSVGCVVLCVRGVTIEGGGRLVPGRWQSILEGMYSLVVGMIYESVGKKGGEFVGKVFTLFLFILVCNLIGLVPYSYTVTAQLIITFTLSLGVWIGKVIVGFRNHGIKLFGMFIPAGAPFEMVPFFVFIEILGFIIPLVSLAVRLFANMMSGHILLKVLFGFAWSMMMAGGILMVVHVLPLGVLFLLLGLETAVALIQAYVFTLLTCIYIGDMISGGH